MRPQRIFFLKFMLSISRNNATTLQNIVAEAEIAGQWITLKRLSDLSNYQLVFDPNKDDDAPFPSDAKTKNIG